MTDGRFFKIVLVSFLVTCILFQVQRMTAPEAARLDPVEMVCGGDVEHPTVQAC